MVPSQAGRASARSGAQDATKRLPQGRRFVAKSEKEGGADRRREDSAVALGEQLEPQRIQFDEARGILLVIGAGIILEGDVAFAVQAVRRFARAVPGSAGACDRSCGRRTDRWHSAIARTGRRSHRAFG